MIYGILHPCERTIGESIMKEHIYSVDGKEVRARYYSDRLEIVIDGVTVSLTGNVLVKYVRNICNVYLSEYPIDGEVIYQQEETLLTTENNKVEIVNTVPTPVTNIPTGT